MPGFEVVEARMPKMGIRGTATARLAFHDMRVPKENILGKPGKGLRVALTVLDFGRTTFGASCTGAAKTCLRAMATYAKRRVQFNNRWPSLNWSKRRSRLRPPTPLRWKRRWRSAASAIDRGFEDYMLETAMLKVFTTERLWECINDVFQIYGGSAYFVDLPLKRMMRDARINQIGEGANEAAHFVYRTGGHARTGDGIQGDLRNTMMKPTRERGIAKAWAAGKQHLAPPYGFPRFQYAAPRCDGLPINLDA